MIFSRYVTDGRYLKPCLTSSRDTYLRLPLQGPPAAIATTCMCPPSIVHSITHLITSHIFSAWDSGVFTTLVIFSGSASTFAEPRAALQMICRLAASLLRSPSDARFPPAPLLSEILRAPGFAPPPFFFSASHTSMRGVRAPVSSRGLYTRANFLTPRPSAKPPLLKMPPTNEEVSPLLGFFLHYTVYLTPNTKRHCCAAARGNPEGSRYFTNIYFFRKGIFTR